MQSNNIPAYFPNTDPFEASEAAGGVLRVSAAPPQHRADTQQQLQSAPESVRVYGGTYRTTGAGDAESVGIARHVVSHEGTRGGSVMATARQDGATRTAELVPGSPASRTSIAVALREGLIRETSPGVYEDVSGAPAALEQALQGGDPEAPGEGQQEDPSAAILDKAEADLFQGAVEFMSQPAFDAATASVMLAATLGGTVDDAVNTLARSEGIDPQRARALIEQGVALNEGALARAVAPRGISGERFEAFKAYCRERPAQLAEALQGLVYQRDPAGFLAMAGKFAQVNEGDDVKAYRAAGLEVHICEDGEVLVKQPGRGDWMSPAKLAKQR